MRLPDPRDRPWLTVAEVSTITREGEKAVRAALSSGQLPRLDVGRYVRIPTAALWDLCGIPLNSSEAEPASSALAETSTLDQETCHGDHATQHPHRTGPRRDLRPVQ
jgi:hypothetical protein